MLLPNSQANFSRVQLEKNQMESAFEAEKKSTEVLRRNLDAVRHEAQAHFRTAQVTLTPKMSNLFSQNLTSRPIFLQMKEFLNLRLSSRLSLRRRRCGCTANYKPWASSVLLSLRIVIRWTPSCEFFNKNRKEKVRVEPLFRCEYQNWNGRRLQTSFCVDFWTRCRDLDKTRDELFAAQSLNSKLSSNAEHLQVVLFFFVIQVDCFPICLLQNQVRLLMLRVEAAERERDALATLNQKEESSRQMESFQNSTVFSAAISSAREEAEVWILSSELALSVL